VLSRANLFSKWRQIIILLDIIQRGWKMSGGSCPHPAISPCFGCCFVFCFTGFLSVCLVHFLLVFWSSTLGSVLFGFIFSFSKDISAL
jgi:hypothetical protein